MSDILLRDDGNGYYLMRGETAAGRAFVAARSTHLDHNGNVSIGCAGYANVIADAKTEGLEVRQL